MELFKLYIYIYIKIAYVIQLAKASDTQVVGYGFVWTIN